MAPHDPTYTRPGFQVRTAAQSRQGGESLVLNVKINTKRISGWQHVDQGRGLLIDAVKGLRC